MGGVSPLVTRMVHTVGPRIIVGGRNISTRCGKKGVSIRASSCVVPSILGCVRGHARLAHSAVVRVLLYSRHLSSLTMGPRLFVSSIISGVGAILRGLVVRNVRCLGVNNSRCRVHLFGRRSLSFCLGSFAFGISGASGALCRRCIPLSSSVRGHFTRSYRADRRIGFCFGLPN